MKYLSWLLKAAIFFTLFAFALNNQQDVTLHFFFGTSWRAPLVLVVLAVFSAGVAIGVLGMVPRWWKHRRAIARLSPKENTKNSAKAVVTETTASTAPNPLDPAHNPSTPSLVMTPPYGI